MNHAQRLANHLDDPRWLDKIAMWYDNPCAKAAAELRRLDAREAELLALLRQANERLIDNRDDVARTESARYMSICYDPLIVAIRAATGETK